MRYTRNQFDFSYQPTVAVCIGNVVKKVNVPTDAVVSVAVWDLPGREEVDLRRSYYKDIDAAIVVVDVSSAESITSAAMWKEDILNNCDARIQHSTAHSVPILLLGNKLDQLTYNSDSGETPDEVLLLEKYAEEHGFAGGIVVSAKDADGSVHNAVQALIRHLLEKRRRKWTGNELSIERVGVKRMTPANHYQTNRKRLSVTNIPQFDQFFEQCEEGIADVECSVSKFYLALSRFRKQCAMADIGVAAQPSLEDCITALKKMIDDQMQLDKDTLFPQFTISDQVEQEVPLQVWTAIEIYQNEVVSTAEQVLSSCPIAESLLCGLYDEIDRLHDQSEDLAVAASLTKKAVSDAVAKVDANMEKIKQARNTANKGMQAVESSTQRVKSAMMW